MRIVCIGDSITFGQFVERERCWTTLLSQQTGHTVINRGVCGDTTRLGLERFPRDVQDLKPDIVLIQFGFNDCNRWESDHGLPRVSLGAFRANLEEMAERVRQFRAHPIFLPMFQTKRGPAYLEWLIPYARHLDSIERNYPWWGSDGREPFETIDGLHLTEDDHVKYAETVGRWL